MITPQNAVNSLRPGAEWSMNGEDVEGIVWHTPGVEPLTWAEVEAEMLRLEQARQDESAAKESARLSARARLSGMGFTDAEIDAMYPNLAALVPPE